MREQNLSNTEVRTLWRNRTLRDKQMLFCLSQLEACDYHEMRERLISLGLIGEDELTQFQRKKEPLFRKWGRDEIKEVFRMRANGFTAKEIASTLGRTCGSVNKCVQTYKRRYE